MVEQEHVQEFKSRNRIFYDMEDARLKRDLEFSYQDIQDKCGVFNINESFKGRELVYERTRYEFNDCLEDFYDNFLSDIVQFQLTNMEVIEDGTI
ncbi:hypothetical protein [Mammaliicoccus vitulinus]|uniref:Uncharacterized protein n=1 Tax=Mammaliicoccus vitulinus TaxID=71237 RepID=A0ABX7HGT7_9STAP|nr:hypothetical protein [Mammaliicoccus vitulinus]PNZ38838.1 hypothetical protein CD107_06035 [Mammaliicoccus vitulinus]QRO85129.1 hypothetical protein I6J37_00015 [Mammaliicoccus vitulinus]